METSMLCSSFRNQAYTFSCSHLNAKLSGKFCPDSKDCKAAWATTAQAEQDSQWSDCALCVFSEPHKLKVCRHKDEIAWD